MTLLEKLSFLMNERDLNKKRLSEQIGMPYSTIDGFFKVGYENMKLSTFKKLCRFFGVTMDSMAFDDREIEYYDPEAQSFYTSKKERELLRAFRSADKLDQALTLRSLKIDTAAAESSRPLTAAERAESKRASAS